MLDVGHLIRTRSANLAHTFGDSIHAVDIGFAELPAMRIDGEFAADLDPDREAAVVLSALEGATLVSRTNRRVSLDMVFARLVAAMAA